MYQPSTDHREERLAVQHALMRAYPLGTLIASGPDGLLGNPVPFVLDEKSGTHGVLRAHVARADGPWRALDPQSEVLIVFMGPQTYVSPSWCATKQEAGKIVPTWNYASVHVYGRVRVVEDREWLLTQIRDLTDLEERDRPSPWSVDDAPASFIASMLDAVVGLEVTILRIEGKWKVSQTSGTAGGQDSHVGWPASGDESDRAVAEFVAGADDRG
jgi:transcriptional regulator